MKNVGKGEERFASVSLHVSVFSLTKYQLPSSLEDRHARSRNRAREERIAHEKKMRIRQFPAKGNSGVHMQTV